MLEGFGRSQGGLRGMENGELQFIRYTRFLGIALGAAYQWPQRKATCGAFIPFSGDPIICVGKNLLVPIKTRMRMMLGACASIVNQGMKIHHILYTESDIRRLDLVLLNSGIAEEVPITCCCQAGKLPKELILVSDATSMESSLPVIEVVTFRANKMCLDDPGHSRRSSPPPLTCIEAPVTEFDIVQVKDAHSLPVFDRATQAGILAARPEGSHALSYGTPQEDSDALTSVYMAGWNNIEKRVQLGAYERVLIKHGYVHENTGPLEVGHGREPAEDRRNAKAGKRVPSESFQSGLATSSDAPLLRR
ncbi:hypothetical protein BC827DRAFT_1383123 [Russula dissimulans]|nr:hypothetical protein BC827DRAFT_1383123 [Russula dissimulans]